MQKHYCGVVVALCGTHDSRVQMGNITEYIKDQIWILEYPVSFQGMDLYGRTTIIKLNNDQLIVHDPC
ncbi:MAG TPA: hypothetical protein VKA76_15270, partial [Gammaproteobacteria bacterium]|nr:hypothetical protein [Gammaproteobacteria bacterium]